MYEGTRFRLWEIPGREGKSLSHMHVPTAGRKGTATQQLRSMYGNSSSTSLRADWVGRRAGKVGDQGGDKHTI